jgi:hypothetical protein
MPRALFLPFLALLLGLFAATGFADDKDDAAKKKRLKDQEDAIAKIQELKGSFELDPAAKEKLILKVNLAGTSAKNADLEVLKPLLSLEELNLGGTKITNSGLANIKKLVNLRTLNLRGCGINNDATPYLKELLQLQSLSFEDTEIGDAGLDNLKKLKQLTTLNVRKSKITDKGMDKIKKMLPECTVVR